MGDEIIQYEKPDTFLLARSPAEMQQSQAALLSWMEGKLTDERKESRELKAIVNHAKERKWKTSGLAVKAKKQADRVVFYEKAVEAIKAGYTLIPDFPIDVFAVRVKRDYPEAPDAKSDWRQPTANDLRAEWPDNAPAGEGEFKSTTQVVNRLELTEKKDDGTKKTVYVSEAIALKDPVFPLRMAQPALMQAASQAMLEKVFDEIGLCPATRRPRDPMLIGRIRMADKWNKGQSMSFLIAWFLDLRTL